MCCWVIVDDKVATSVSRKGGVRGGGGGGGGGGGTSALLPRALLERAQGPSLHGVSK